MATRNSDVNLVIRARDEATRGIESVTSALNNLFGSQEKVAGSSKKTGDALTSAVAGFAVLDKAVAGISAAADRGERAFETLNTSLDANRAKLAAMQAEYAQAQNAIKRLGSADAIVDAGRDQTTRLTQLGEARNATALLEREIEKLGAAIARQEAQVTGTRSALQQLSSTEIAAKDARATATAQIELETQALARQAAEAQRVTEIQNRINLATGVNRQATFDGAQASQSAAILATADALYREAEARDQHIAKLREEERAARENAEALARRTQFDRFMGVDGPSKSARESASVFQEEDVRVAKETAAATREAAAAEQAEADALARIRQELNPLGALQAKYAADLEVVRRAYRNRKVTLDELRVAEAAFAQQMKRAEADVARNGKQGVGIFGLRPYEATNLGYQINDLITQIGSGTSVTQALMQQGGQILQLFPRISAGIVQIATSPGWLLLGASIGAIVLGFKEIADRAERLREFSAALAASADGAAYNAAALSKSVEVARRYGTATADATAALKTFVAEGVAPDRLDQFTRTAQNMADVLGVKIPEAAKQLADGFTGGYDAIVKLDESTNFLTRSQREHIRTLFDEGKAQQARAEAFAIFSGRQEEAAQKQRGPWTEAVRSLSGAWQSFLDVLANSTILRNTAAAMANLAGTVDQVIKSLGSAGNATAIFDQIISKQKAIAELQEKIAADPGRRLYQIQLNDAQRGLETLKRQYQEASGKAFEAAAAAQARAGGSGDTASSSADTVAAKREADALRQIDLQGQLNKARERLDAQEAGRLAGLIAAQSVEGDILKAKTAQVAREKEIADIQQKADAKRKSAAAEREREIRQFEGRVVGAEGGTAQNPYSTAKGFGQFTEGTFLDQFRKVFADQAASLSREQILALRNNSTIAKAIIDNYARENAKFLESFGAKVTAGNLYLAHFLGPNGAKKVLQADEGTPVSRLLSQDTIDRNKSYLTTNGRPRTAGELRTFIAGRVGDTGQAQSAGVVELEKLQERSQQQQEEFNLAVRQTNEERARGNAALKIQNELQDTSLIFAQREIAIAKSEFDLRQKVDTTNRNLKPGETPVTVTQQQIDDTKKLAAAEFDLANARALAQAKTTEVQRPVDDLTAQQQALQSRIDFLRSQGDFEGADALGGQLDSVNDKLRESIDLLIEFYRNLDPADDPLHRTKEQIDATIVSLQNSRDAAVEWGQVLNVSARDIAHAFATSLTNALDKFTQKIVEGKNVFSSLKNAFLDFASSFLRLVAQMIIQMIALKVAMRVLNAVGVPVGTNHTGGIAGRDRTETRMVSPAWFSAAVRYHTGGIAGLKPNEVPAILERGEEVLTRNDPRHRQNGGGAGGGGGEGMAVNNINLFDPDQAAQALLNTKAGTKAILNVISMNPRAVKSALGG